MARIKIIKKGLDWAFEQELGAMILIILDYSRVEVPQLVGAANKAVVFHRVSP